MCPQRVPRADGRADVARGVPVQGALHPAGLTPAPLPATPPHLVHRSRPHRRGRAAAQGRQGEGVVGEGWQGEGVVLLYSPVRVQERLGHSLRLKQVNIPVSVPVHTQPYIINSKIHRKFVQ